GVPGALVRRAAALCAGGARPGKRGGVQHAQQAVVHDGLSLRVRRGGPGSHRRAQAVQAVGRHGAAGIRATCLGRRLERRGARRTHARGLPPQAGGAAADTCTQRNTRRRERRDDVLVARSARRRVVGDIRRPTARAWTGRLAGNVLRSHRRGLLAAGARPHGGGVPSRGRDPRGGPVNADRVEEVIAALDRGELRVAEPDGDDWRVNPEAQEAILEYFRLREMEPQEVGPFEYHDKIPLKRNLAELGVRVVPPAVARYGAYLSPGVVMMPSYVNIGAWVGPRTMVDTWATVGSGAQIGADVHLAGGVGIGGVLEPPGARPVIVEDGAFIGSRAILTEGVHIGACAVLGPNVCLTASVPVLDVTGSEPVEHRGSVPPRAVVVPGTRPRDFPAGTYQLACALISGRRTESTAPKVSL